MKQKLSERFNQARQEAGRQSPEQPINPANIQVSEHMSKNTMEFIDIQPEKKGGLRIGVAASSSEHAYNAEYCKWMQEDAIGGATDQPESIASTMNMFYNMIKVDALKNSHEFERPTTYAMDSKGNLIWSASNKPDATGLVLVRKDGTAEHLGMDETVRFGVINDIKADDKLYLAPNKVLEIVIEIANEEAQPASVVFENVMNDDGTEKDDAYPVDLVCVNFNHVDAQAGGKPDNDTDAYEKRKAHRLRVLGLPYDATPEQIEDAEKARKAEKAARRASKRGGGSASQTQPGAASTNSTTTSTASATAPGRAYGFTDSQTAILDRMKDRRTSSGQANSQELDAEPEETDPEIANERQKLIKLRNAMAEVAAKRQGRLFSLKNNKYTDLETEYDQQLALLGKLKCADLLNDDTKTDSEKNVGVIAFIFDEQQRLRKATTEQLKNTRVSKMIEWVNSGTPTQRILKGAALGAGGVLVGAGVGAIAGVAGAGFAAAAAVTATSAMRFGRYYAKEENKRGGGMDVVLGQEQSEKVKLDAMHALEQHSSNDKFATASKQFKELFDADTKKEQKKRRESARHALGGVALGMVIGGTAAYAISELIDSPQVSAKPVESASEGGGSAGLNDGPDTKQPDIIPDPVQVPEYSHDASTVSLGEGWYQTFGEIGITDSSQQYALLHNPALMQELTNQGLAYPDATLGGWGINMTADGKMPVESLKLIEDYARRSGYDLAS